ncbi:glycosyltransferase family 39 protein [Kineococcus sp. SYSU DK005]|uniref:glycosyltransferase family 39 protein n=1 Tax=Kineococcus sp. SYSU DK005 TaxID=3383126 RepID=UPI003D7E19B3
MTTSPLTTSPAPGGAAVPAPAPPPRWSRGERAAVAALLAATAALHLWDLSASGWANSFYSGAVQAMTKDWTAFFFGSADAGNTITVDKPPASLWVVAASARVFGLSSWSVLVPQALMGVAAVAVLHGAVRRVAGPVAALVAGAVLALTPVAVLMFRFNNPDALLVLLLVSAAHAVVRALEAARTRWLVLAGVLVGFAFLTKTAQALLPLPAFALAHLWAAPTGFLRRVGQLLAAGAALVAGAGWWFLVAGLWPAGSRPYIGGSTDGTAWDLAVGYNGLGRLFGNEGGGAAGAGGAAPAGPPGGAEAPAGGFGGGGGGFSADAGWLRMFGTSVGGQVSWLLPAALLLLVAAAVVTWRRPRTDRVRASLVVWGGWTLVTALVFSLMEGTFHQYYTVALAPGIAGLVGVGGAALWARRERVAVRAVLSAAVLVTGAWAFVLLGRTPGFVPWLRWVVAVLALAAAAGLLLRRPARLVAASLAAAVALSLAGPAAYAAETVTTPHTGSIPLAGPATAGGAGLPGGGARGGSGRGAFPGGAAPGAAPGAAQGGGFGGGGGGGGEQVGEELVALLRAAGTTWSAATTSTSSSAGYALASGTDVVGIGGFSGSDPAPTLERFQQLVADGQVRYFLVGGGGGGGRGGSSEIATWVRESFSSTTVDGTTVYDLTAPLAG